MFSSMNATKKKKFDLHRWIWKLSTSHRTTHVCIYFFLVNSIQQQTTSITKCQQPLRLKFSWPWKSRIIDCVRMFAFNGSCFYGLLSSRHLHALGDSRMASSRSRLLWCSLFTGYLHYSTFFSSSSAHHLALVTDVVGENLGCHCPVWWLGHLAVVMNLSVIDSTFNSRADNGLASLQQWSVDGCGFAVSHIDLHFYWSGWDELACASVSSPGSFPTGIYLPQCVYVCLCAPSPWWPHVVLSSRDWCVHVFSTRALGVLIPELACACSHSLFPVTFPCTSF